MTKKFIAVILAISLTLLMGIKVFAADTIDVNLGSNQQVSTNNEFSGYIDTYRPANLDTNSYQANNDLQLNLDYRRHDPEPRHHHGDPGYYGPYSPGLWMYTMIGIIVVHLLTYDEY
jgi:hypothetical protein